MKKLLILILPLILLGAGCNQRQRVSEMNDQNILEYKKCQDAGMRPALNYYNEVICSIPK